MIFKAYLRKYQFFPIVHLANDENHEVYNNDLIKKNAKIYFFVKSKNYFSDVRFSENAVHGKVVNTAGHTSKFKFNKTQPFSDLILKEMEKSGEREDVVTQKFNHIFSYKLIGSDIIILLNKIYGDRFKNKLIQSIFINILKKLVHPRTNVLTVFKNNHYFQVFHLYQLINGKAINTDKDFLQTNILYIGKSDNAKGILEGRIYKHEKHLPILGEYGTSNDEILVFIFEILLENKRMNKNIYIPIVEEILIRYFSPGKNKQYVTEKKGKTSHVQKLIDKGFTDYYIELIFDDAVCRFGSEKREFSRKHIIKGKLENLHNEH